jgi:hypothetical protein
MLTHPPTTAVIMRREWAIFAATVFAVGLLLGPGFGIVNAICGPAADITGEMSWPELAYVAPEDAFVRAMTALGLVLAVRLLAGVTLAFVARVPGRTGVRAARISIYVTPPHARRFVRLIITASLSSWTGVALAAPALAATQPTATVVPAPVLAPPEALLQNWPDLGRPGTDVPTAPAPSRTDSAGRRSWPDLGRPGTTVPSAPAPTSTVAPRGPSSPIGPTTQATAAAGPSAATGRPTSSPTSRPVAAASPAGDVVVEPGDCLWTLAQRDLDNRSSAAPSPADVALATQKWWQTNRAVIGADPDQLMPGQHLRPPA